ncbi:MULTISPECIES: TrbI/VirB10 family protein [unclassified Sphingopyxis]|uniref:TrbI/VirB10 family protein n=2 Tax=Sphingopyxis TaxID=165697 RepID=UPI0028585E19|nr:MULTISPECIES: TrbI/VirB10 family protein [unclassified Sphingopyxis]MDR7060463.1 type IV secretion system protein VirB10 [Sphingopyxis sp. BE235]MDR7180024.1 type IV secretion system protein VirB10 [Sphingopyxis sp. BE249]
MSRPEDAEGEAPTAEMAPDAAAVAPASPDGFRLEGELPRVMRLSRKTLAVLGGTAGIAIGGALLWALRPVDPKAAQELYEVTSPNRSEAVTGAPADYGAVPKLGPPLPGDLGRPIVSAQKAGEPVPVPAMGPPTADPRQTAREQARQRALQEREVAEGSRLFLGGGSAAAAVSGILDAQPSAADPAKEAGTHTAARKAFLARGPQRAFESSERVVAPSSAAVVQAGTVIPAALITGIRSDLPGQITAQVTQNVYDSPTGRLLLIPQGARLVGEYDSDVAAGQRRVLLAWDRLILPGGGSIRLDREPAGDASGMAGAEDRVNNHWGRMLRAAVVSSFLGIGTELAADGDGDLVRALRSGLQDSTNEAGRRLVERELSVPPTLTVRPGFSLRVIVTRDLILEEQLASSRR